MTSLKKLTSGKLYRPVERRIVLAHLYLDDQYLGNEVSRTFYNNEYFLFVESLYGKDLEKRLKKKFDSSLGERWQYHHFITGEKRFWLTNWSILALVPC